MTELTELEELESELLVANDMARFWVKGMVMSRRAKRSTVWAMYAAECERRGINVLYVDNDSTCVRGLSYDSIIIDEFVDVVKEQDNG